MDSLVNTDDEALFRLRCGEAGVDPDGRRLSPVENAAYLVECDRRMRSPSARLNDLRGRLANLRLSDEITGAPDALAELSEIEFAIHALAGDLRALEPRAVWPVLRNPRLRLIEGGLS